MFWNKYPYTDVHEMNLDWILCELIKFQTQINTLKETIETDLLDILQPEIDAQNLRIDTLSNNFNAFKAEVNNTLYQFNVDIQHRLADMDHQIQELRDLTTVVLNEAKLYSDIQNDNLYNRIINDVSGFLSQIKVTNYITGELMSIQSMFDYLCMFHLANPLTYTQLALKNITYTAFSGLGITWTDVVTNGNILIP